MNPLVTTILSGLDAAYALIDADGVILQHDATFGDWIDSSRDNLCGNEIWDIVPELFGYEPEIAAVQAGHQTRMRLDVINRVDRYGRLHYFSIVIVAAPEGDQHDLMLIVIDNTEQNTILQDSTQSRNELRLVRRELARANQHLDLLLNQYVSHEVAHALRSGNLQSNLSGAVREVSVLFADIRGYTPFSERVSPAQLFSVLNSYLTVVIDMIDVEGGTIAQIQGDAVMAIFNAPNDQPDHAYRAVRAAQAIQRAVLSLRETEPDPELRLQFGVGIHTGAALVGNSGAPWRMVYTANGDSTNLAARITAAAPPNEIWISGSTAERVAAFFILNPLPPKQFKGKSQRTMLFQVVWDE